MLYDNTLAAKPNSSYWEIVGATPSQTFRVCKTPAFLDVLLRAERVSFAHHVAQIATRPELTFY